MAAAIEQARPDVRVELIKGERGAFLVVADGKTVFDKLASGRFPEEREIIAAL